jgi:hypothetical protein
LKKYLLALILTPILISPVFAVDKPGRANTPVVQITGDTLSFSRTTLSSSTVSTLAAYSLTRSQVTCVNTGAFIVYIGSFSTIASAGPSTYELNLATNVVTSSFRTMNSAAIYGVVQSGPATGSAFSSVVYCYSEQ